MVIPSLSFLFEACCNLEKQKRKSLRNLIELWTVSITPRYRMDVFVFRFKLNTEVFRVCGNEHSNSTVAGLE